MDFLRTLRQQKTSPEGRTGLYGLGFKDKDIAERRLTSETVFWGASKSSWTGAMTFHCPHNLKPIGLTNTSRPSRRFASSIWHVKSSEGLSALQKGRQVARPLKTRK